MQTIYETKLNELFGYKLSSGNMKIEELEERTAMIWSYKGFCVGFGFPQRDDGQAFQTVRVWQQDGDEVNLRFETEYLVATDNEITRLAIKRAEMNIDRLTI